MNSSTTLPHTAPHDEDLAEQARPGHGVPSQDPDAAAQMPLAPGEAEREARSALAGGGMVGGAAIGATIGAIAGGPVGVVIGGTLGGIAGTLGAAAAGSVMNPADKSIEDSAPAQRSHAPIARGVKP